jgi:glutathione S-transferase
MLELYHAEPVANSMKVLICLKEKGLDFVSHYVDLLRFEQHEPEFIKLNPNGQVPVLVHGGVVITESTVINEYLEDVFPEPRLRPRDPAARARMRIWSKFVDEYFCPALSMIGWHVMVRRIAQAIAKDELEKILERIPLKEQRDKWATVAGSSFAEEQLADSRRRLKVSVEKMEAILSKQKWLAGHEYSLADVNTYSMAAGLPRMMPDLIDLDAGRHVLDWLNRMDARPAVQEALEMPNRVPETLRAFGT